MRSDPLHYPLQTATRALQTGCQSLSRDPSSIGPLSRYIRPGTRRWPNFLPPQTGYLSVTSVTSVTNPCLWAFCDFPSVTLEAFVTLTKVSFASCLPRLLRCYALRFFGSFCGRVCLLSARKIVPRGPGVLTLSRFRPGGRHPEKEVLLSATRCYSVKCS